MDDISDTSRPSRWLGPGELARRLGISIKALRVYERAGLVVPGRREGGWRTYGPRDVARLHELLALRSLGLSLAEVKAVLEAPASSLERTLDIQQRHLVAQLATGQKRLAAVNSARRRLREAGSLSLDELLALASETSAPAQISADQVEAIIHGYARDDADNEDLAAYHRRIRARLKKAGIAFDGFEQALSRLVADAGIAAQQGDSASDQARALAMRWHALVAPLAPMLDRGGAGFGQGVAAFAARLVGDPDLAAGMAFLKAAAEAHPPAASADAQD